MSMQSISGSSMPGKYDRELTYRLKPARANSWIVASWSEPFGMPSLSFISFVGCQRSEKARSLAGVTHIPISQPLHLHQHRVVVAVDEDVDYLEPVARGLA